eukprot:c20309_g1_i1 orf=1-390(-)
MFPLMEWLDRIFKISPHHSVSEGQYNSGYDDGMGWGVCSKPSQQLEDEELDHALALSLSESDHRIANGRKTAIEDADEDLAKALQASLDTDRPYPTRSSDSIFAPIQHIPSGRRICEGCKNEIGYGRFLS